MQTTILFLISSVSELLYRSRLLGSISCGVLILQYYRRILTIPNFAPKIAQ